MALKTYNNPICVTTIPRASQPEICLTRPVACLTKIVFPGAELLVNLDSTDVVARYISVILGSLFSQTRRRNSNHSLERAMSLTLKWQK